MLVHISSVQIPSVLAIGPKTLITGPMTLLPCYWSKSPQSLLMVLLLVPILHPVLTVLGPYLVPDMLVLLGQTVGLHPDLGSVLVHPLQLWLSLAIGPNWVPDMLILLGQPVSLHPGLGHVLVRLLQLLLPLLQLCLVLLLVFLQVSTPKYEKNIRSSTQ
jgi:hypothetical protein